MYADVQILYGLDKVSSEWRFPPFREKPSEVSYAEVKGDLGSNHSFEDGSGIWCRAANSLAEAITIGRVENEDLSGKKIYQVLLQDANGTIEVWEYEHEVIHVLKKLRKAELRKEVCHLCDKECVVWDSWQRTTYCKTCISKSSIQHIQCAACVNGLGMDDKEEEEEEDHYDD